MSALDRGWQTAGSACAPGGTFWKEDEVSGAKWEPGVGCAGCEPALGLRLRDPEERGKVWAGPSSSALFLRPRTAPSFPEAEGAASGLLSCWYGSLAVKKRTKGPYLETKTPQFGVRPPLWTYLSEPLLCWQ